MNGSASGARARPAPLPLLASGWRWLPLGALVILLDQLSKAWIERHLELYESLRVFALLNITRLHNTGAAFSFLADRDGWQRWFFTGLAGVVSIGILLWLRRLDARRQPWLTAGLALVLGGALGNLIDRLRLGFVIDFVHAHWEDAYFPAFNVADSAISVGAALLVIDAWLEARRRTGGAR
jgi:signal peptidase II